MNLTCSNKTIKYLMFVFNFIFVITGIIILAMGVSVKAYYYPYDTFLDAKYFTLPNMLIATGALIFFISFLGCYGAMRENWLMLMAFSLLLAIIFIFELSIGIAGYVLRDKTSSYLETKLYDTMDKYNTTLAVTNMWDLIQEEFQCCGVHNSSDWHDVFNSSVLPVSCCPSVAGTVGTFYCNSYVAPATEATTEASTTVKSDQAANVNASSNVIPPLSGSLVKLQAADNDTTPTTTGEPSSSASAEPTDSTTLTSDELTTETSPNVTETSSTESSSDLTDPTTSDNATTPTTSTNVPTFTAYPSTTSNPYTTGCEAAFGSFLKAHAVDIGAVGITLAFIQLVGIFFSFHLARQLKNGYYST